MLNLRIIFLHISKNLPIFPSETLQTQKNLLFSVPFHVVMKALVYFIPANKKDIQT